MTINERKAVRDMMVAYNTDFAMQDEAKVNRIKKKFLMEFTVDVTAKPDYVLELLEVAYNEKNAEDVEWSMNIAGMFDLFSKDYLEILLKLLGEDWHYKHEDIVSVFQQFKIPESVDILYETALKRFNYLEYDEFFALAVKCIWALGEIGTEKAKEKLKLLAQSDNEIIKDNALRQLERMQLRGQ
ncbi:MAG: adaptin domain-containing protein [Oscillospiraceae bacterium]|nr:adaptin domain-containing protein [Oscillospiraceae bacterium]